MIKIERSVVINRPVEEVFAFVGDFNNEPKFVPALVRTELISKGPIGVGTRYREVNRLVLGLKTASEYEIIAYEPNRKVEFKSNAGPAQFKGGYYLEAVAGGTKVTLAAEAVMVGPFRLVEPMIAPSIPKQVEASLANLKTVLEAAK